MVDGKIYGLPMEVEPMAMYYSVKAFEEAGLSEKDIPKTWDQFMEVSHKLTKGNRFGCLFETTPGYYQTFTFYPFMWQGGGDIATPDGKKSAFNSPGTVQALKFWQDSIKQNVASRNFLGWRRLGCGGEFGLRLLRDAERWHLGGKCPTRERQGFPVWCFSVTRAARRYPQKRSGRMVFRCQRQRPKS